MSAPGSWTGFVGALLGLVPGVVLGGPELGFRAIDAEISHKSVHALLEDHEGFVWFGTKDGLNRYDGYQVRVWRQQPDDPDSLLNSSVLALEEDDQGRLWVGTEQGLARMVQPGGRFHEVGADTMLTESVIFDLARGGGRLWVGAHTGLYRVDPSSDAVSSIPLSVPWDADPLVLSLAYDHDADRLFVLVRDPAAEQGLVFTLDSEGRETRRAELAPRLAIALDAEGRVWVDQEGPLDWELATTTGPDITAVALSSSGPLWLGTIDSMVDAFSPGRRYRVQTAANDYLGNYVRSLMVDSAGEVWVGTFDGVYRSIPGFRPFHHLGYQAAGDNSLSTAAVASIHEDPSGRLWVGTFGGGVNRVDADGRVTRFPQIGGESDRLADPVIIWDIASRPNGVILLGTQAGIYRMDPESGRSNRLPLVHQDGSLPVVRQVRPQESSQKPGQASDPGSGQDSRFWIGTMRGLMVLDEQDRSRHVWPPEGEGSPTAVGIESMQVDAERIWLGTTGIGLLAFDIADGRTVTVELPPLGGFWDLCLARDGRLFLGTGNGLGIVEPVESGFRFIHPDLDLPGDTVYGIREDPRGHVWMGTNGGLVRWDGHQTRVYRAYDGTGNIEYNRHAVASLRDGRLAFGGMDGLTWFDPLAVGDNPRVPPVVFTQFEIHSPEGVRRLPGAWSELTLSHQDYTLAMEFAALDYVDPERNQYRYRLAGFDPNWIEAGSRRRATYTRLPAGHYVFEVQGANNDGVWNRHGARLPLTVLPPFWETAWFRTIAALAIIGLIAFLYRLRVGYLLRVERMRLRIAGDLHDEIGSDLSGIAIASDLVRREMKSEGSEDSQLREISRIALRTAGNLRDIVWYINPEHDRGKSLRQRMQATAQSLLADMDYRLDFDERINEPVMAMDVRRNVHRVFKEALNNIHRHAGASSVDIRVALDEESLVLTVADNGRGFDVERTSAGIGLTSMRNRLREIGGSLRLESDSTGTRLQARVPLPQTRDGKRGLFGLVSRLGRGRTS